MRGQDFLFDDIGDRNGRLSFMCHKFIIILNLWHIVAQILLGLYRFSGLFFWTFLPKSPINCPTAAELDVEFNDPGFLMGKS